MARRKLPPGLFGSEAELCDLFMRMAHEAGYKVHAEVSNWDIVLVDPENGEQIGVEAKLRPSVTVLAQALSSNHVAGPDVHAVLVPEATDEFIFVAGRLDILVLTGACVDRTEYIREMIKGAHRWKHKARIWVPEVEVIVPAGMAAPKRTTPWKLSAVKLCLKARSQGYVTSLDMKQLKLDRKWWFESRAGTPILTARILDRQGHKVPARGEYVLRDPDDVRVPDKRWPEIAQAILAEQARVTAFAKQLEYESCCLEGRSQIGGPRERRRVKVASGR